MPAAAMVPSALAVAVIWPPVRGTARICRLPGRTGAAGTRKVTSSTGWPPSSVSSDCIDTTLPAPGCHTVSNARPEA
ncbi:hypothetical protein GO285_05347 [Ralstonia solanacearum]|nr:hypothetical protein [Ralstonia solanacearum]